MNNNGTFMQKLLWAISGNEVWIIKDCPTAHKYYSRQGLLFVMTFFFAAFCGAFAGNDFSSSDLITILFGLIWGLLVYSIDQMMVQTIDKVYANTISNAGKFWKYFFPRIFLGCLLALFMSSPLDHYLFREQIEDQMQKNADTTWMQYQTELQGALNIKGTKSDMQRNDSIRQKYKTDKENDPNSTLFKEAKANHNRESPNIPRLETDRDNKNAAKNQAWNSIPIIGYDSIKNQSIRDRNSYQYRDYLDKKTKYDNAVTAYNNKKAEVTGYQQTMDSEKKKHEEDLNSKIQKQDTIIDQLNTKIIDNTATIEQKTKDKQVFLDKLQGFDTKFMTLLTHPNFGVQFLRWFIFLVFLLIEILPTWMKLMGKPTEYDVKLDKIRKKRITEFETIVQQDEQIANIKKNAEIYIATEKEQQRKIIELDLLQKTLTDIGNKYENITKSILQDWEDKVKQEQRT
jgi:hypothetical protein